MFCFGRCGHTWPSGVHLSQLKDGIDELACDAVRFASGSILDFNIRMKKLQTGWRITQFKFHLRLPAARKISMVRVHLNVEGTRDALVIPRCHLHIGGGKRAHVPFPIMSPRLTLQLVCDVIEPDCRPMRQPFNGYASVLTDPTRPASYWAMAAS